MNETWRDIKGYEGLYRVSNLGRVKSLERYVKHRYGKRLKNSRILKLTKNKYGYMQVGLSKYNSNKTLQLHSLVAKAFIPNTLNKRTVNHINAIKTDNRVENLEWMTTLENMQHAWNKGLMDKSIERKHKKVLMLSLDNEPLLWFDSIIEAGEMSGIYFTGISKCCKGKLRTSGGYKWKFYAN